MRCARMAVRLAMLGVAVGLLDGCNESDGGSPPPGGPDLSGEWSGRYVSPGVSEPFEARVIQDGDAVVIQTTRAQAGRLLTGTMDRDAKLRMTDGYNSELWTSASPATPHRIHIHDYLQTPTIGYDPPLQDLILTR